MAGYELKDDGTYDSRVRDLFELAEKLEKRLQRAALENSSEWLGMDEANARCCKSSYQTSRKMVLKIRKKKN